MIYFKVIRFKNFLSTGNTFTEIQLDKHDMTLVIGKNGAGKSTLLDALCFVLFGRPFRKINMDNLINSINGSQCLVEVEFRAGAVEYLVRRGRKPDTFEIWQDGVLLNQDASSRDYQKYLENTILDFNMKSFTQIVIVGSSNFIPFMQLKTWERRIIIEDLLDIGIFSTMNKVLAAKIKQQNETISNVKNAIQTALDKIEMQKKFINEAKRNAQDNVEAKQRDLSNNEIAITEMRANVNVIMNVVSQLQSSIDEKTVMDRINKLESFRIKIDKNVQRLKSGIEFYQTNDYCPTCQQNIQDKDKIIHQCEKKLKEQQTGFDALTTQQNKAQERLNDVRVVQRQIFNHQTAMTRLITSIDEVQKVTQRLMNEIAELTNKKPISDDMMRVSQDLFTEINALNDQRKELIDLRSYYDLAGMLLQDGGIKAKIIRQYIPIINKMVNKYLASMEFFVDFHLDEEFKETIKSRHRDEFVYDNFSEGEKLRIDIALLFTWRAVAKMKNSVNTNLLIMDEILDGSLDAAGMDEFMRLLNAFGNETNVFLISHRGDILADKFQNVITFAKSGNFSEIVSG